MGCSLSPEAYAPTHRKMQMREKNKTKKDRELETETQRQTGRAEDKERDRGRERERKAGRRDRLAERKNDIDQGERGGEGRRRKV